MSDNTVDLRLARQLGDRHLRSTLHGKLAPSDKSNRVALFATSAMAQTFGGQHLLWMLGNLLARQFNVIHELILVLPAVPAFSSCFGQEVQAALPEAIAEVVRSICEQAMVITQCTSIPDGVDIVVTAGYVPNPPQGTLVIGALGDGMRAFVGRPDKTPAHLPTSSCSVGPYFAACMAAGEVFKRLCGMQTTAGTYIDEMHFSVWDHRRYPAWDDIPSCTLPGAVQIPDLYLVGVGAVGQALVATLSRWPGTSGYLTLIDGDDIDGTNLNRYVLATFKDVGKSKVSIAKDCLEAAGYQVYEYAGKWEEYLCDERRPPQKSGLFELESEFRYRLIISCVDKNPARHSIQKVWPQLIIGASTLDLRAMVTLYDLPASGECLMCYNPVETNETLEQLAEKVRSLTSTERLRLCEEAQVKLTDLDAYLANPSCGSIGEVAVRKFKELTEDHDWSVGFVSVIAGVMLAVRLIRLVTEGRSEAFPLDQGNSALFNFWNPALRWSNLNRKSKCECGTSGLKMYSRNWGI